jgi:hypothetical protein
MRSRENSLPSDKQSAEVAANQKPVTEFFEQQAESYSVCNRSRPLPAMNAA